MAIRHKASPRPTRSGDRWLAEPLDQSTPHGAGRTAQTVLQAATVATPDGPAVPEGRLVHRTPEQLRAHSVYLKVCGPLTTATIPRRPAELRPIIEPLLTTRDGLILDGHERWALARQQGRPTLPCIEYDLTDDEALIFMLDKHRRTDRLNDFCRIVMALALEPYWRARAREHQRQGGAGKLSSKLTKADTIDVRVELARAAGVGTGNVTKVKQLLATTTPKVRDALRRGEVTIHRAWQWRRLPPNQQNGELMKCLTGKNIQQAIRHNIHNLLRNHEVRQDNVLSVEHFATRLARFAQGALENATLHVAELPGPAIVVTRDLYDQLLGETRP